MFAPNLIFNRSKRDVPSGGRSRHSISECDQRVDTSPSQLFDAKRIVDCCRIVPQGNFLGCGTDTNEQGNFLGCGTDTNACDRGKISKNRDAQKIHRVDTMGGVRNGIILIVNVVWMKLFHFLANGC